MSATQPDADPSSELRTVGRNLYHALLAARPYVAALLPLAGPPELERHADAADAVLEQVDGALAEAADYLGSVPS